MAFHTLYPSGLDTPIRVDYRLRVPRQVRLDELSTLEGDIVVHDVHGSIEAHNLHGDIEGINVSGSVVAHALTGNILISLRALPDRRLPFTLATINGNVDLVMPAQANADLELSTVAGNIAGDYPFQSVPSPVIPLATRKWAREAFEWNCGPSGEIFASASATMICEEFFRHCRARSCESMVTNQRAARPKKGKEIRPPERKSGNGNQGSRKQAD